MIQIKCNDGDVHITIGSAFSSVIRLQVSALRLHVEDAGRICSFFSCLIPPVTGSGATVAPCSSAQAHLTRRWRWILLPFLVVISACTFLTHCKTKTTPTSRSNVFTPAISIQVLRGGSFLPLLVIIRASPCPPVDSATLQPLLLLLKPANLPRCSRSALFVPACARLRAPGQGENARQSSPTTPETNKHGKVLEYLRAKSFTYGLSRLWPEVQ